MHYVRGWNHTWRKCRMTTAANKHMLGNSPRENRLTKSNGRHGAAAVVSMQPRGQVKQAILAVELRECRRLAVETTKYRAVASSRALLDQAVVDR